MIILLFGQPASGKTTLADKLQYYTLWQGCKILIDGDKWREITQNKDYSKEGRIKNLKGAFDMALYLEKEGFLPILSFVTPYEELRNYLNEKSSALVQIYLTYNTDRGRNSYFATEFEQPSGSYLHLDTSELGIDDCLTKIKEYVGEKSTH
jgi:adenylylsulfate kinase-like enzyme